nr:vWA domain-containing protein [uncultured Intestinibacter sp.]
MKKYARKFLAFFVSFVMAVAMVPMNGFVSHAETIVGDSSTVETYYEKVNDPTTLDTGDEVLITYETKALVAKSGSTLTEGTIAGGDKLTEVPDGSVWKVTKSSSSSNNYFFKTDKVSDGSNQLRVSKSSIDIGSETNGFTITSKGKIYRVRGWSLSKDYSITYNNGFTGIEDEEASNSTAFTFYKKVQSNVKLTINYKLDENTTSKVEKEVKAGDIVDVNKSFPSQFGSIDDYEIEKIEYNSSNLGTDGQIKVNGNSEITVYYKQAEKVNFSVEYYLNGTKQESDSSTTSVKKGTQTVSIPSEYSKYTFSKMTVNGVKTDKATSFDVNSDTTVRYYYSYSSSPDAYLPDGDLDGEDQPEYPNPGAVRFKKDATSDVFAETGLTRVELGVTGVAVKKGIDVVIVLDESGSMAWDVNGNATNTASNKRIYIAKQAARNFAKKILANNEDGTKSNNRVSVVSFNTKGTKRCDLKNSDNLEIVLDAINKVGGTDNNPSGGTDYDAGVKKAYDILNSAKQVSGYNRSQAVLFMSDGAPTNGYNGKYNHDRNMSYSQFGDAMTTHKYSTDVKNLGATMYTVGFGLAKTDYFTVAQCEKVLRDWMASSADCFKSVKTASELDNAFQNIAASIRIAGTNANLTDKISPAFELQMAAPKQSPGFDTSIKVLSYDLDETGNKTGTPEELEVVTFSADGKTATSSLKGDTNILDDNGNINAEKFTYNASTRTFTWKIGDITQKEVVLSFAEYLTDSMSQTGAPKGNYPTNDGNATLTYTNYKDNNQTKTKESPVLPWGSASIKVQYYLVNEDGKPVNTAGTVIKEGFKVVVDEKDVAININQNTTINANDTNYLPSGYQLLNENAYYTVTNPGQSNAQQLSSNADAADKGSTLVYGDKPYTTSTVAFGVLAKTDLQEDTVVLDYGKPVTIDVRENDGFKSAKLNGVSTTYDNPDAVLNTGTDNEQPSTFAKEVTNKYGKLAVKNDKEVTYTPEKYMEGVDKYYYSVKGSTKVEDQTVDAYKYSSVSIIPATSVYYEDNFGGAGTDNQTGGIYFNKNIIKPVGTDTGKEQSSENNNYGNDSSYSEDATDSNGSSTKITGNGAQAATFTFTGTGFDLIGRTTTETGKVMINVYAGDTVGDIKDRISSQIVNTVYQSGDLYQIPVYNWNCSEHEDASGKAYTNGQYTVEIKVARNEIFYLDAVRIYNPIDVSKNTGDATTAKDAYDKADESNPQINEIRELLLTQNNLGNSSAVFVDKDGKAGFDKFKEIGPNNEVYLAPGQSVGFNISADSVPKTIQIGAKAPNGQATFTAYTDGEDSTQSVPVGTQTLKTATDMYYKLDTSKIKFVNGKAYIMISNTGDSNVISITNIKLTFDNAETKATFVANEEVIAKTKARTLALNKVVEPVEILNAEFTTDSVKVNKESTLVVTTSSNAKDITILDSNGNEVTPTSKSNKLDSNGNKVFTFTIKHTTQGINNYKVIANGEGDSTSESVDVSINVKKQTLLDIISSWFK